MSYLDVPCPLCHTLDGVTVELHEGCDSLRLAALTCACDEETLMSGPFDEVVAQVLEWRRNCHPFAINGERSRLAKPFQPMRTHDITIHRADYDDLAHGRKHFILLKEQKEPRAPLHYGDILRLTSYGNEPVLVRWVSYVLGGYGLAPDWIIVEVQP